MHRDIPINIPINDVSFEFLFRNVHSFVLFIDHSMPCDFMSLLIFPCTTEGIACDFRNSIFSFTEH
jgi:accessory gene regulator protein AgrB